MLGGKGYFAGSSVLITGTAGIFFLLDAQFVGATQLLVYVGGTLVLVVFGVMLTAQGPFINMKIGAVEWVMQRADNSTEIYSNQGQLIRSTGLRGRDDIVYAYSDATTPLTIEKKMIGTTRTRVNLFMNKFYLGSQ